MVKDTQSIRRQKPTSCLSVFDHFVGLTFKGLTHGLITQLLKIKEKRRVISSVCLKSAVKLACIQSILSTTLLSQQTKL